MAEEKLQDRIRRHFKEALDGWRPNRQNWKEDLQFVEGQGNQWPKDIKSKRLADERPCLEINKLPSFVDQITGDQLQNRPSVKCRPVDNNADPETAEILTGLIRNIENVSDAYVAYDTAFEGAVKCGFGAWRILTRYCDDESFNQEIYIRRIANQFKVYPDPLANELDYSDGRFWFITEEIPQKSFKRKYPKAKLQDFTDIPEDYSDWVKPETVRIAEYWYKKIVKNNLYRYKDHEGAMTTANFLPDGMEAIAEREIERQEIWHCKTNGYEFLEEPRRWAGKYFPIIAVWGKEEIIESRKVYRGIVRHAKDPQRLYNYNRSLQAETTALAPKAPWLLTPEQIAGHEAAWKTAHIRNWPYLLYNPDPQAPAVPQRNFPTQLNTAIQAEINISDQEIHDTTGLQLASLGKASNERSGVAIERRQAEGDRGSFGYITMLGRALKYQGKVLVDLIPKIYDTPRVERILGIDDKELHVPLNQPFPVGVDQASGAPIEKIYDLNVGKYDVVVTIGPSYQTKRQEAAENMISFIRAVPEAGAAMIDLVAKYQDWPGAAEIEKRLKKILPPGLDEEAPPPQPDPAQQIELAKQEAELAKVQAEVAKAEAEAQEAQLDIAVKRLEIALKEKELSAPPERTVQ